MNSAVTCSLLGDRARILNSPTHSGSALLPAMAVLAGGNHLAELQLLLAVTLGVPHCLVLQHLRQANRLMLLDLLGQRVCLMLH